MAVPAKSAGRPPRLRLRTVLLLVNLLIFVLPLGALGFLRVYDSQLVRQTESELLAQGAFVVAAFRERLGTDLEPGYGRPVGTAWAALHTSREPAVPAQHLDLWTTEIRPRAEDATAGESPEPRAAAAGALLAPLLAETTRVTLAGIRVVDFRGVVVATSRAELGGSMAAREEVRRALDGEPVSLVRRRVSESPAQPLSSASRNTGVRVFVALPVVWQGRVLGATVLSRTPMSLGKAYYQDRYFLLVTALVLIAVVLGVSVLVATTVVRPVQALMREAERIAGGRPRAAGPAARPATREIALLLEAVGRMAGTLGERADYIRAFAAAVSHEFKTPLASIRGTVELLRDHAQTMPADQRERFLANLAGDAERLERLVRRLLELARADVIQPAGEPSAVRLVLERLRARPTSHGRALTLRCDPPTLTARMDADTLESVLGSLVDNAFQHAGADAKIEVTAAPATEGGVQIRVRDDGAGVSPGNEGRIWDPFFTTARDTGGTGLGLTIARTLVRAHGGTLELEPGGPGATFSVRLPA